MKTPPPIPPQSDQSGKRIKMGRKRRILIGCGIALGLAFVVSGLKQYLMPTGSMSPTLPPGSYLLAEKLTYRIRDPRRGEIVVFSTKNISRLMKVSQRPQRFIMRVAGIPGDELSVVDGKLLVNGAPYIVTADGKELPFLPAGSLTEGETVIVPQGRYFVLGDNSSNSFDSRMWGVLPRENIERRYILTFLTDKNFTKRRDEKRRREYERRQPTN